MSRATLSHQNALYLLAPASVLQMGVQPQPAGCDRAAHSSGYALSRRHDLVTNPARICAVARPLVLVDADKEGGQLAFACGDVPSRASKVDLTAIIPLEDDHRVGRSTRFGQASDGPIRCLLSFANEFAHWALVIVHGRILDPAVR